MTTDPPTWEVILIAVGTLAAMYGAVIVLAILVGLIYGLARVVVRK